MAGPLFFGTVGANAQQPQVQVALVGKAVVATEAGESLVPADKAKPGDVIQYEATYRNIGDAAVHGVAATVPIPQGTALAAESAKPAAAEASLDGKFFNPMPLMRDVKNAQGVLEKQPVPLAEYRALRWLIADLGPHANAAVSLRVRVLANAAPK